jgi:hypothetical protein
MTLKPHTVFENDGVDLRVIDCACKNKECKIGLSFDSVTVDVSEVPVLRLHDKYGNEHFMQLSKESTEKLMNELSTLYPQPTPQTITDEN